MDLDGGGVSAADKLVVTGVDGTEGILNSSDVNPYRYRDSTTLKS